MHIKYTNEDLWLVIEQINKYKLRYNQCLIAAVNHAHTFISRNEQWSLLCLLPLKMWNILYDFFMEEKAMIAQGHQVFNL